MMDFSQLLIWLASDNGQAVHTAVIIFLLLGGVGIPIPEDLPIMLAGVAASKRIVSLEMIFATCYFAVILSDQFVYLLGSLFGNRLLSAGTRSPFFPSITEDKVEEVREGLRKRRLLYIFLARHLFPIRSVTFLTAGALRIPFGEFLLADAIAALISVSLVFSIGYLLGGKLTIESADSAINSAHFYLLTAALVVLVVVLLKLASTQFRLKRTVKNCDLPEQQKKIRMEVL